MRVAALVCIAVLGFPTISGLDFQMPLISPGTTFEPWNSMATAIIGVRFESSQPLPLQDGEVWHVHRAKLLSAFRGDARLPEPGHEIVLFEPQGVLCTEDGVNPPWNCSRPIPPGERIFVILVWDEDVEGFRICQAVWYDLRKVSSWGTWS